MPPTTPARVSPQDVLVGQRIREMRMLRGLSLRVVADVAGMSPGLLSRIERGLAPLLRRTHVQGLAYALKVSPSELLGLPYPISADDRSAAQSYIEGIRAALMGTGIGVVETGEVPLPPLDAVVARAEHCRTALCRDADYTTAGAGLDQALLQLHAYTTVDLSEPDRLRLMRTLSLACCTAAALTKELGYSDLAWVAADRACQAALAVEDHVMHGLASTYVCYALQTHVTKLQLSLGAIDRVHPIVGDDPRALQILGQLHLRAAHDLAVTGGNDVATHLAEARAIGQRVGERTDFDLYFGPTNIEIWALAIAIEQGEGGRAREIAQRTNVHVMPSQQRRSMWWCDVGRALAQGGQYTQALSAFLTAERLAPVFVHANPFARQAVLDIRDRARRTSVSRELSGLVQRMGIFT